MSNIILTRDEKEVIRKLFQHPAGADAMDLIYTKFVAIDGFDPDPYIHARNAGRRGMALLFLGCATSAEPVVGADQLDTKDIDNTQGDVGYASFETRQPNEED